MGKVEGVQAENYFISELNRVGLMYEYIDGWFDFIVGKSTKVEVKSCQLAVKDLSEVLREGRFDFTNGATRILQHTQNIWVCFILRHYDDFMLLGFIRAGELEQKRYIHLHSLFNYDLVPFDEWIKQIP